MVVGCLTLDICRYWVVGGFGVSSLYMCVIVGSKGVWCFGSYLVSLLVDIV